MKLKQQTSRSYNSWTNWASLEFVEFFWCTWHQPYTYLAGVGLVVKVSARCGLKLFKRAVVEGKKGQEIQTQIPSFISEMFHRLSKYSRVGSQQNCDCFEEKRLQFEISTKAPLLRLFWDLHVFCLTGNLMEGLQHARLSAFISHPQGVVLELEVYLASEGISFPVTSKMQYGLYNVSHQKLLSLAANQ